MGCALIASDLTSDYLGDVDLGERLDEDMMSTRDSGTLQNNSNQQVKRKVWEVGVEVGVGETEFGGEE